MRREVKVPRQEKEILRKARVDSTDQCNTVGFRCCPDRRCGSGEAGPARRIDRGAQEGAVGAMEGWRIHQRHRPGTTEACWLHSRNARSHRRDLSASAAQRRCALTPAEREEISRGLATGESLRAIAAWLGRSASTVCREVNRNGGRGRYRAAKAEEQTLKRSRRPRRCLLATACGIGWPRSYGRTGRHSRSPVGSKDSILTMRRCACHTRRSTVPCSFRPEAL